MREPRDSSLQPKSPRAERPFVLLVEDDEDTRDLYIEYFKFVGVRVEGASGGAEALTKVRALKPDIVVLDLNLPGMSGWEVARELKASAETKAVPILALTADAMKGSEQAALDAGCDRYRAKPCLPKDLVVIVCEMVRRSNAGRASNPSSARARRPRPGGATPSR